MLCAILAALIVQNAVAAVAVRVAPSLAARLAPGSAAALVRVSQMQAAAGRSEDARRSARAAVSADPGDIVSLRVLALTEEQAGRPDAALRLMRLAGRMSWRDSSAHAWLLQHDLLAGDMRGAMLEADSLLRRTGSTAVRDQTYALLIVALQYEPRSGAVLADRLALQPPWRAPFLQSLGSLPMADRTAEALLRRLRSGPAPPTAEEAAPLVRRRVTEGRFAEAWAAWRSLMPHGAQAGWLRDGSFLAESDQTPFTWGEADSAGASEDRTAAPGLPGLRALRIDYDDYSDSDLTRQLVVLPPGRYRLSWRERGEGEVRAGALAWSLRCAGDNRALASAPLAPPPEAWRSVYLDFDVDGACPAQWLQVTTNPGERRAPLALYLTSVALSPR